MMENFVRTYMRLMGNLRFREFQNDLTQKVYDTLAQGYIKQSNEVALVGRMVDAINGANFNMLNFHADKIHGARSYVEFNYRDKPTTKEIADMVIISVASYKRERIYQKISFIQNKVSTDNKWGIDEEQLFLLKNFPKFSGSKGIFKSFTSDDIVFLNHSRCLGSYGLFTNPGEMIFMSAPLLAELKNEKNIALHDIKLPETEAVRNNQAVFFPLLFDHPFIDEMLHYMSKSMRRFAFAPFMTTCGNYPFLNNTVFSRDIYDFIRNWTQFNIGEPTYVFGNVVNSDLDKFSNHLLNITGIREYINLPESNLNHKFDNEMAIFVMHLNIE